MSFLVCNFGRPGMSTSVEYNAMSIIDEVEDNECLSGGDYFSWTIVFYKESKSFERF